MGEPLILEDTNLNSVYMYNTIHGVLQVASIPKQWVLFSYFDMIQECDQEKSRNAVVYTMPAFNASWNDNNIWFPIHM